MKPLLRSILPGLLLILLSTASRGQNWLGLNVSNFAGSNSVYANPSFIADSRFKVYVNVAGANTNIYNSYLKFEAPYSLWQGMRNKVSGEYQNADGNLIVKDSYLREVLDGRPKFVNASAEIRLPSVMISLGERRGFAFTNRVRLMVQANNISESVARLARYSLSKADSLGLAKQVLKDNKFAINTNNYHEFAFSYAQVISQNPVHFMKAGITAKYLVPLGGGFLNNRGLSYEVYDRDSIQLLSRDLSYGYTDNAYYSRDNFSTKDFYNKNRLGSGYGVDLGFTYEFRPAYKRYNYRMDNENWVDNSQNKYKMRVGLSVLDLGRVKYSNDRYIRSAQIGNTSNIYVGSLDTLSFINMQHVDDLVNRILTVEKSGSEFKSKLPATMALTADYKIKERFYVAANWTQSLISRYAVAVRTPSSLSIIPRFEHRQAEFSLPIMLAQEYRKVQVGAMLRVGPVFAGSDNLGGLFGASTATGYDLYFGAGITIGKKRHKDKDGDQVSDKLDNCRDIKGTWALKGCPDRDGDGIGDEKDACPDEAGLAELNGCPDKDRDGVTDKQDDCPEVFGLKELKGCPDRDKDGVKDMDDKCPDTPGPAEHFGCPDTDGDTLYDFEDTCPTEAGPVENKGCPYRDRDGDMILDKDDACADIAGPIENKGCPWPDTDGDGVLDKDDECPKTPGPASNKGCPELKKEEVKVLNTAFRNLEFQTNKDVIKATSFASLNELAELMKVKPEFRLRLSGHTDNVGTPQYNLELSKKRATAVKKYLVSKGVDGTHIETQYFGRTKPIASNKTEKGRALNRRVEMKVIFE